MNFEDPRVKTGITFLIGGIGAYTIYKTISTLYKRDRTRRLKRQLAKDLAEGKGYQVHYVNSFGQPGASKPAEKDDQVREELIREQLARNYAFLGEEGTKKVRGSFVIVVGLGGVGSHAAHMLLRAGVEHLRLIDFDQVSLSSLNRHAVARRVDVGTSKAQCLAKHFKEICPESKVEPVVKVFELSAADELLAGNPDYVLDCIDNLQTKVELIKYCKDKNYRIISSMGAGAKADPSHIQIADISDTFEDPLARATRKGLKLKGVDGGVPVVYSSEKPGSVKLLPLDEDKVEEAGEYGPLPNFRARILPVLGTLPALFGNAMATYVITELAGFHTNPLPIKQRTKVYERIHRDLKQDVLRKKQLREKAKKNGEATEDLGEDNDEVMLTVRDTGYLLDEVFKGRSIISGALDKDKITLCKWNPVLPHRFDNMICVTRSEAESHSQAWAAARKDSTTPVSLKAAEDWLESKYGKDLVGKVEAKFKEVREAEKNCLLNSSMSAFAGSTGGGIGVVGVGLMMGHPTPQQSFSSSPGERPSFEFAFNMLGRCLEELQRLCLEATSTTNACDRVTSILYEYVEKFEQIKTDRQASASGPASSYGPWTRPLANPSIPRSHFPTPTNPSQGSGSALTSDALPSSILPKPSVSSLAGPSPGLPVNSNPNVAIGRALTPDPYYNLVSGNQALRRNPFTSESFRFSFDGGGGGAGTGTWGTGVGNGIVSVTPSLAVPGPTPRGLPHPVLSNTSLFGYLENLDDFSVNLSPRPGQSPIDDSSRFTRKRTLSWADIISPGSARFDFPARLLSPPVFKKPTDAHELQRKQLKAQELRDSLLTDKTARLRSKAERAQAKRLLLLEQQKILRESIEEKHAKAEKLRDLYLKSIQDKAKGESQKLGEVAIATAQNIENLKNEVAQRHLDSEARRQEIEEERQRKVSGTAALQEAAMERRKLQEAERLAKLHRDEEKKRDLEARREREKREALAAKVAMREEKMRRVAEVKSLKIAEEQYMRRELHEKLQTKLERGSRRYEELIEQRKIRAAVANQNARAVAQAARQLQQGRTTPDPVLFLLPRVCGVCGKDLEAMEEDSALAHCRQHPPVVSGTFSMVLTLGALKMPNEEARMAAPGVRDKTTKRRTKKIRQRLKEASESYSYIPRSLHPTDLPKTSLTNHLQQTASLLQLCRPPRPTENDLTSLNSSMEAAGRELEAAVARGIGDESRGDLALLCTTGAMMAVIRAFSLAAEEATGTLATALVGSNVPVLGSSPAVLQSTLPPCRTRFWYSTLRNGLHLLLLSCQFEENREHLLLSGDALSLDFAEFLLRLLAGVAAAHQTSGGGHGMSSSSAMASPALTHARATPTLGHHATPPVTPLPHETTERSGAYSASMSPVIGPAPSPAPTVGGGSGWWMPSWAGLSGEGLVLAAAGVDVMRVLARFEEGEDEAVARAKEDLVSYIICVEFFEKIRDVYMMIQGPFNEGHFPTMLFLHRSLAFLESLCVLRVQQASELPVSHPKPDPLSRAVAAAVEKSDLPAVLMTMMAALALSTQPGATAAVSGGSGTATGAGWDGGGHQQHIGVPGAIARMGGVSEDVLQVTMVQSVLASEAIQFQFFHLAVFWIQSWAAWSRDARAAHTASLAASPAPSSRAPSSPRRVPRQRRAEVGPEDPDVTDADADVDADDDDTTKTKPGSPTPTASTGVPAETMLLHELLLLLGHACLDCPANQAMFRFVTVRGGAGGAVAAAAEDVYHHHHHGREPHAAAGREGGPHPHPAGHRGKHPHHFHPYSLSRETGGSVHPPAVRGTSPTPQPPEKTETTVLLQMLVAALPFRYFCLPWLRELALGTLLVACVGDPDNVKVLAEDLGMEMVVGWLEGRAAVHRRARKDTEDHVPFDATGPDAVGEMLLAGDGSGGLEGWAGEGGWLDVGDDAEDAREAGRPCMVDRVRLEVRFPVERWEETARELRGLVEEELETVGSSP
ncbi:hypothetical protein HDU96_003520 [Phlyctochytrium bullatum]|nr:hypothetical protein HDU96_003520 [Phlyctochytrium bullatum]